MTDFVAGLTAPAQPAPARPALRWRLIPAAVLAIVLAMFGVTRVRRGGHSANPGTTDNLRVVAVLPFRNLSHDTTQQYFSGSTRTCRDRR